VWVADVEVPPLDPLSNIAREESFCGMTPSLVLIPSESNEHSSKN
jgi:hypothetical protein